MKKTLFVGQKRLGRIETFAGLAAVAVFLVSGAIYAFVPGGKDSGADILMFVAFGMMGYFNGYTFKFYIVTATELRVMRVWPRKKVYRLCDVTVVELVGYKIVITLKDGELRLDPPIGKMSEYFIQLIRERAKLT